MNLRRPKSFLKRNLLSNLCYMKKHFHIPNPFGFEDISSTPASETMKLNYGSTFVTLN